MSESLLEALLAVGALLALLLVVNILAMVWAARWIVRHLRPALLVALYAGEAGAEPMGPPAPITRQTTMADAWLLAYQDAKTLRPEDLPFQRWLHVPDITPARAKALALVLNFVGRSPVPQRPITVGTGILLRVDIRVWAPGAKDLQEWIDVWEELRFDPASNILLTPDILENIERRGIGLPPTARVRDGNGKFCDIPFADVKGKSDVIRLTGGHIDPLIAIALQDATLSAAPVVDYRYFVSRSTSTFEGKGAYKVIFGGLYYPFRGIKKSNKKGQSDLDLFLKQNGIREGIKIFDEIRSDQRTIIGLSGVTGKVRRVDIYPSEGTREDESFVSFTLDVDDEDIDIGQDAFKNVLDGKFRAIEAISTGLYSIPTFALFKFEDGSLQDVVPPGVAHDRTIPEPYTPNLQGAIACIRCHSGKGFSTWQPLRNDVKDLLRMGKVDIVGDIGKDQLNKPISDTNARIAGLYTGSFDKKLVRARQDYEQAVLRITGPWEKAKKDQTDVGRVSAQEISDIYARYNYTQLDAQQAILETVGLKIPKKEAVDFLDLVLLPDVELSGELFPPSLNVVVVQEDVTVARLKAGQSVSRPAWALVQSFTTVRAQRNLGRVKP